VVLPDAAAAVDEDFIESAAVRLVRSRVAQVPLAEDGGCIAGGFQDLCHRGGREAHPLALENRVRDAGLELVPSSQEGTARRRACWTDMKICQADALLVQVIE